MAGKAVIVFLKAPEQGRVKTRLAKKLNKGLVIDLYKAFVIDILDAAHPNGTPEIFYYPQHRKKMIVDWLGQRYPYTCQAGSDLGERMVSAFEKTFNKGYDKAVLIGTDIPELNVKILKLAFERLAVHDLVLGPSRDGGYYLIGFNRASYSSQIFNNIAWSTPQVFAQTLDQANQNNLTYFLLPELNDIDTLEDFNGLIDSKKQGHYIGPQVSELIDDWVKHEIFIDDKNG